MSLGMYDISQPSGHDHISGMTPYIPGGHPTPKHAKPAPFDPSRVTLEGNANYLGSRKLRASNDEKHVKVRELLDQDAVVNGCKVWHRETEYMNTGNVRLGPMCEYLSIEWVGQVYKLMDGIADSKLYRFEQLFPSPTAPSAPALMHLHSTDSVSSTSSTSASTSTDVDSARTPDDDNVTTLDAAPSEGRK